MLAALELRRLNDPRAALATLADLDRSRLGDEARGLADRLHAEASAIVAQRPAAAARPGGGGP
jgi:hypothetical protein